MLSLTNKWLGYITNWSKHCNNTQQIIAAYVEVNASIITTNEQSNNFVLTIALTVIQHDSGEYQQSQWNIVQLWQL